MIVGYNRGVSLVGIGTEQIVEAASFWCLPTPSTSSTLATNNFAWRCGDVWLKATAAGPERQKRSIAILDHLEGAEHLALPRALRTGDGLAIVEHAGLHWTAETAVSGAHPNPNSTADYYDAWAATRLLHEAFARVPHNAATSLIVNELRLRLRDVSLDEHQKYYAPVAKAAEILKRELDWIKSWTAQVIHGDVSHPNILLTPTGCHGFIDFEFVSIDPIEFDFATLITTLLVRSSLDGQTREAILAELIDSSRLDTARVLTAALARRWLAAVANLSYGDGPNFDILQRQLQHLSLFTPLAEASLAA